MQIFFEVRGMYRALYCLTDEHAAWAMPVAGLVCAISSFMALRLLHQMRRTRGREAIGWLVAAGFSAGAGTWSTHFVGMLGYDPDTLVSYDPPTTILSFLIAITASLVAFWFFERARDAGTVTWSGLVLGLGITAMHFIGMAGVRAPGHFTWDHGGVVLAVLLGSVLSVAALQILWRNLGGSALRTIIFATATLTAAIWSLHFVAMAAAHMIPDALAAPREAGLPRAALATGIAAAMIAILGCSALFLDHWRRVHRALAAREADLNEKTRLLDATLESMDQGLVMMDSAGIVRVCNARVIALLDLPTEMMRAQPHFDDVRAHQIARNEFGTSHESFRWIADSGLMNVTHVYERERPNGTVLEIRTVPRADGGAVRTFTDITARKAAELALAQSEERLALALDAGSDGLWDWHVESGKVWFSNRWWEMIGYRPGEFEPTTEEWFRLIHPDDLPIAQASLDAHIAGDKPICESEYRLRTKGGSWIWVHSRGKVVARDDEGSPIRIVGTHVDVTDRKAAELKIAHMARHDVLTELPNRALFFDRLETALAEPRRPDDACTVLLLDLDRFKGVNDTLGHLAGDTLLHEIARRIEAAMGTGDTVARLGGDEFAILIQGGDDAATAKLATRIIEIVQSPVRLGEQWAQVGLSIGIARAPHHGNDAETIYRRADLALYRAKAEGRNTHRTFEPAMDRVAAEKLDLERDLRAALAHDELTLHWQPQIRSTTRELVGFEALVRWHHPELGLIPPQKFISLAEETGLIVRLGEWVLRAACREAASWSTPLRIAVNLSPSQFMQANLPDRILAILTETGLSPSRLELEITERGVINDLDRALSILRRLKSFGISIAMDDFGTGHSSLATLQAFAFDRIKIDGSFVGRVEHSEQAAVIVKAVLGLGRSLGMNVIAEGVETFEQMNFLTEHDCHDVQGYLFGEPQPIFSFAPFVHKKGGSRIVGHAREIERPQRYRKAG